MTTSTQSAPKIKKELKREYRFYRHRNGWRISFCGIFEDGYATIFHAAYFCEFEDALRETYRLNGWGEPKNIKRRF